MGVEPAVVRGFTFVPNSSAQRKEGRPARRKKISVRVTARLRKKKAPDALTVEAEVLTQRGRAATTLSDVGGSESAARQRCD